MGDAGAGHGRAVQPSALLPPQASCAHLGAPHPVSQRGAQRLHGDCSALVPGRGEPGASWDPPEKEAGGGGAPCPVKSRPPSTLSTCKAEGRRWGGVRHHLPDAGTWLESVRRNVYHFKCTYFKIQRLKVNCQEAQKPAAVRVPG